MAFAPLRAWFAKAERRGPDYTNLDAVKFIAILGMTLDHIGDYFFPECLWLRAVGRFTVPIWFYLIGYSLEKRVSREIWICGLLLILYELGLRSWVALFHPGELAHYPMLFFPFPVNMLITIALTRLLLAVCDRLGLTGRDAMLLAFCGVIASLPTYPLFEYGTIAFVYALVGRLYRLEGKSRRLDCIALVAGVSYFLWQALVFQFGFAQNLSIILCLTLLTAWMVRFTLAPICRNWRASRAMMVVTLLSRNTIPYYFYHRALFEAVRVMLL